MNYLRIKNPSRKGTTMMKRKLSYREFTILLLALVLMLLQLTPASSQTVVGSITITDVDASQFPNVEVTVRVLDGFGVQIPRLSSDDLILTESGEETIQANYSHQSVQTGIEVVIVIDNAVGVYASGASGRSRLEEMKATALRFINSVGAEDAVEIIVVNPPEDITQEYIVVVAQSFTNDQDLLRTAIDAISSPPRDSRLSNGLAGVEEGLSHLRNIPRKGKRAQALLLLTSGIQTSQSLTFEQVKGDANVANLPIYIVYANSSIRLFEKLDSLAINTGVEMGAVHYTSDTSLDDLLNELDAQRSQFKLSFRSSLLTSSQRLISVAVNSSVPDAPQDTYTYLLDPAPTAPQVLNVLANNGAPIVRTADTYADYEADPTAMLSTEALITANVTWPDDYSRQVMWAELIIDNTVHGVRQIKPGVDLSFTWDISAYVEGGETTALIQIRIEDELGFQTTTEPFLATILVNIPPPPTPLPPCDDLTGISFFLCEYEPQITSGAALSALLISMGALGLAIFSYRFRHEIGGAVKGITTAIVTTLRLRRTTAKASLMLEAGQIDSGRTEFSLFGTTKIGRDRRYAGAPGDLTFHQADQSSPISGLHSTIVEEDGRFLIRDEGSSNGTFVNGKEVGDDLHPLEDGDMIELAEVERGGLRFRFTIGSSDDSSESDWSLDDDEEEFGNIDFETFGDEDSDDEGINTRPTRKKR